MAFCSPSTGKVVRAVLFDTFGTVVDWRGGVAEHVEAFARRHGLTIDALQFAHDWRACYQPSLEAVRSGNRPFVLLDELHRENLEKVLAQHCRQTPAISPNELDRLNKAWHYLPPWPDSIAGIAAIKSRYITGPLSNANTSLLLDMARYSGIPWDVIIGSDITGCYKPAPRSYLRTAELLGLHPGEVMLAAAHNTDLAAAQRSGLATAFIPRRLEYGPRQQTDLHSSGSWDLDAASIVDLAAALLRDPGA